MADSKLITEKIIQIYNIFIVKLREKNYKIIENHPDRVKEAKKKMILSNVYSMRMNVDLAFKRLMLKRLNKAFESKITKESIKRLLSIIIDELEQPSEELFDIFEKSTPAKIKIDLDPLFKYLNHILELSNRQDISKIFMEGAQKDVDFYKRVAEEIEKGSTLFRALEDMILEFESGFFFPRYFKKGEIKNYVLYHFNPYLMLFMEQRIQNMAAVINFNTPLLKLIPEYYICHNKISQLIYDILKELFELPSNLSRNSFSILSIHFMSVLMLILFEELEDKEKLKLLNKVYSIDFQSKDIEIIAENLKEFQKLTEFNKGKRNFEEKAKKYGTKFSFLWKLGSDMSKLNLHQYSQLIYDYLYNNEINEFLKVSALDNIATAKRDLGEFFESIKLYKQTIEYYEKNQYQYKKFLALKNIAFCYYNLGEEVKANEYFADLEKDLSFYTEAEIVFVYYNLSYRYRLIFNFEKEEKYLNLALEKINLEHPLYFEINNRALEIGEFFDPFKGKLDKEALIRLDVDRTHKKNKQFAYSHLNNNNLDLCQYYLQLAYKNKQIDTDYWKILSAVYIMTEDWEHLKQSGEEVLKLDPYEYFGHFYQCVAYIAKKDFSKIFYHLLKIEPELKKANIVDLLAFANLSRALSFICFYFTPLEIQELIDFAFKKYQDNKFSMHNLLSIFASIFIFASEKELSGKIYKKFLDMEQTIENFTNYAGWCYRFNDYMNAKNFYKRALVFFPNNIKLLECLSRVSLLLDEFIESIEYIDKILDIINPKSKAPYEDLREYIFLVRDSKIRYKKIPFKDVKIIFNTVEYQLKILKPSQDIELGNVLTEFSKGLENLLAKTLGLKIYEYVKNTHFPIPKIYREGNKDDIKPINRIFLNFLDNPEKNNPTMGNWKYIVNGILQNLDPKNLILQQIYDFVRKSYFYDKNKLNLILELAYVYLDDRNNATHKKLYSKEEVETLLKRMIPQINDLIEYLINI